jgi:hypothetical protein
MCWNGRQQGAPLGDPVVFTTLTVAVPDADRTMTRSPAPQPQGLQGRRAHAGLRSSESFVA